MLTHQRPDQIGPAGEQAGFSLVEVLVALMVLGITFGAVLGGMATSIHTSDLHRQQAQVQAVLASAVEKVKSPETTRVPCDEELVAGDTAEAYQDAARLVAPTAAWEAGIEVLSVKYSDGLGGFDITCYDDDAFAVPVKGGGGGTRRLLTLQRVEIRVTHPGGRDDQTLMFVKGIG